MKGQAEYLFALALAIIILAVVALMIAYFGMYSTGYRKVSSGAREAYQYAMARLRGCVHGSMICLESDAPLDVYTIMVSNGTHILWSADRIANNGKLEPVHISANYRFIAYNGSLADLAANGRAWVILVTAQGLLKWQPPIGEPCEFEPIQTVTVTNSNVATVTQPITVTQAYTTTVTSTYTTTSPTTVVTTTAVPTTITTTVPVTTTVTSVYTTTSPVTLTTTYTTTTPVTVTTIVPTTITSTYTTTYMTTVTSTYTTTSPVTITTTKPVTVTSTYTTTSPVTVTTTFITTKTVTTTTTTSYPVTVTTTYTTTSPVTVTTTTTYTTTVAPRFILFGVDVYAGATTSAEPPDNPSSNSYYRYLGTANPPQNQMWFWASYRSLPSGWDSSKIYYPCGWICTPSGNAWYCYWTCQVNTAPPWAKQLGAPDTYWALVYRMAFYAQSSGYYTFDVWSDDGVRVYVDGRLVVNGWGWHGPTEYTASVYLSQGWHYIAVKYMEGVGDWVLLLGIQLPDGTWYKPYVG